MYTSISTTPVFVSSATPRPSAHCALEESKHVTRRFVIQRTDSASKKQMLAYSAQTTRAWHTMDAASTIRLLGKMHGNDTMLERDALRY